MSKRARLKARSLAGIRAYQAARENKPADSIPAFKQLIEDNPDIAEYHSNLGIMYTRQRRLADAEKCFRLAIECDPKSADGWRNLGGVLATHGDLGEAEHCFWMAIGLSPNHRYADAWSGIGVVRSQKGDFAGALEAYEHCLVLNPGYPEGHRNRSLVRLVTGDLARGFAEYHWRWRCTDTDLGVLPEPQWDGQQSLVNKSILITTEQGLGDNMQCFRYMPMVLARGPREVLLATAASLIPLFHRTGLKIDSYIPVGASCDIKFDLTAPIMNLPNLFGTTLETIPPVKPILTALPEYIKKWGARCKPGKLNVGIKWRGNPAHARDRERSLGLELFRPLLAIEGVNFVSLQLPPENAELRQASPAFEGVDDWGKDFDPNSFEDAAGACVALDLVISCDTSIVHLAGAMGLPAWVLITFSPDWRWLLERSDSLWYPTMRLFRQKRLDDWPGVMAEVAEALRVRAAIFATTCKERQNKVASVQWS